jgi:hypothetical protein
MVRSGFFDSINGDRRYTADDLSRFFFGVMTDGIFTDPPTSLAVQAGSGMSVTVLPGRAVMQGKYCINTAAYTLDLQPASYDAARYDRVVLRLDYINREFTLAIKTGSPAAAPQPPELTRTNSIYELSLATIGIPAEQTEMEQGLIQDDRPNKLVCGFAGLQAGEMAFQAVPPDGTAIITHSEPTADGKLLVEIRCDGIADVIPASASWAVGSLAWDIADDTIYALDSSRAWIPQT